MKFVGLLPLTSERVAQNANLLFFFQIIQFLSNYLSAIVFFCVKTFSGRVVKDITLKICNCYQTIFSNEIL